MEELTNNINFQLELNKLLNENKQIGSHFYWSRVYDFCLKGKKFRSSFVLMLWTKNYPNNEVPKDLIKDLIALELIHSSTLIHDDIIDKGQLRRGSKTINNEFGNEIALLTGNLIKDLALNLSSNLNIKNLNSASFDVNLGQLWETQARRHSKISIKHYFSITLYKTAKIFCHAIDIFSSYSNIFLTKEEQNLIISMAILYQIADDLIDYQNTIKEDKSIGQDKMNNVHSFIYASWDSDLDKIAFDDGVFFSDELNFITNFINIFSEKNDFNKTFEDIKLSEQVLFVINLCKTFEKEVESKYFDSTVLEIFKFFITKILDSIKHLQKNEK